ncbi:MAG TPA: metallophosphoesterase [Terriglobales bacterium]|nr:metallophosphoesterase [Terriglobales bacterium]
MVAGAGVGTAAAFVESEHPRLVRVEIALPRLPQKLDGFTIAQLSDFHYDEYFSRTPIATAVKMVNALNPDMVALTGDFVTVPLATAEVERAPKAARDAVPCAQLLGGLRARCGSFAVLGNHDESSDPDEVTAALQQSDIRVLRNQALPVEREGERFWLAGINDALWGEADLKKTLRDVPAEAATVLLCHEPDFADEAANYPVDLQLSGHSHGGQVRLPLIGPPFLPPMARKYPWGLRRVGRMMLYTNCGVGTIRIPVRWNCPPEVTLIILRSGTRTQGGPNNG